MKHLLAGAATALVAFSLHAQPASASLGISDGARTSTSLGSAEAVDLAPLKAQPVHARKRPGRAKKAGIVSPLCVDCNAAVYNDGSKAISQPETNTPIFVQQSNGVLSTRKYITA